VNSTPNSVDIELIQLRRTPAFSIVYKEISAGAEIFILTSLVRFLSDGISSVKAVAPERGACGSLDSVNSHQIFVNQAK